MHPSDLTNLYREHYGRILASLIRALGNFELAEDALQDAFAAAVEQWPRDGRAGQPARVACLHCASQGDRQGPPSELVSGTK